MTLNATLVVQIGNFLLAWAIVRYLFLRPTLKVRDEIRAEFDVLSAERDALMHGVALVKDQEYSAWNLWHLHAHKVMKDRYQPQFYHEPINVRVPTPEIPPHEIEKMTEQLTRLVHKRLQELL